MTDQESRAAQQASASEAAGRLFRAYERHCLTPGVDTLFETLNAMHSLNDRLRSAVDQDFHQIDEFVALKALRNLTHHREEVRANVRVVPSPAMSDLIFLCIVRRDQVERAIESVDRRWRATTKVACESKFHWYGQAVNINPCLFNFMVHAYQLLMRFEVFPPMDAVKFFEDSYRLEEEHGLSHFVDGYLVSLAGDFDAVLSAVAAELPRP